MAETVRADEAETFAAGLPAKEYEYTAALEASVKDLKLLALESALEERDAAREARTPALAKVTAKYARGVRGSLGSMLDRADKLPIELREEKGARRHDRAEGHLRRFSDLVGFHVRTRRTEQRRGADLRSGGGAVNGASEGMSPEPDPEVSGAFEELVAWAGSGQTAESWAKRAAQS